ncbi:MAG: hypothetical protein Q8L78_01900 [Coxiellaceae bacterium]|nr:hypothetical protein [Coxiellaceae bacterium]
MLRLRVSNSISSEDYPRLRIALKSLYEFIVPGITVSATEASVIDGEKLANFIEKKDNQTAIIADKLTECGLAEIATLAFLFYEKSLDLQAIFVEKDFSATESNVIARVICRAPEHGLHELTCESRLEEAVLLESEQLPPYFGDRNAMHHNGQQLFFPILYSEQFQAVQKNKIFNERSFSVILSVMLMPFFVFHSIFLSHFNQKPDIAIFIASALTYNHTVFFRALVKSEAFLAWYFSAPQERIQACAPGKRHKIFLQKHNEFICETRAKITFLLAQAKIESAVAIFDDLICTSLENKKHYQASGLDLYALLLAVRVYLFGFLDGNGSNLLDWFEKSDALYKIINFILLLFQYMQVEIDAARSSNLALFIKNLEAAMTTLWHGDENQAEKTDFVCIEINEPLEKSQRIFIKSFLVWLNKINDRGELENIPVVLCHYERIYREFLNSKASSSKQFYAAASMYVSSFWGAATATKANFSEAYFSMTHFDEVEDAFHNAKTDVLLQRAFVTLLVTQGGEIEGVHKKFLTELVLQFERECIAMEIAFSEDRTILKQSQRYASCSKLSIDVIEAIAVEFIQKIRQSVTFGFGGDDCLTVDSRNFFKAT